ncbi:Cof-type HAD-IIB family hydrolase [Kineothrix sedimenti]|uniref:Cof-type HAD-IIB family hydrolase n=1 Tax=Kineothrix sedimenti TaxID=3123317 RepID=A0ABZ3ETV1_9FIRM
MNIVDLHVHSNKSDGSFSPAALVHLAVKKGLSAFALTDHDTTDGLTEAMEEAKKLPKENSLEVIPGIELSTEYEGKDIHIIGLYIDYETPFFKKHIKSFVDSRLSRNEKMCKNLNSAGIDISYEKLLEAFPGSVITRGHYAKYLLEHGYVTSMNEAFDRYVGDRTKYFVPREKITPKQAVQFILQADGIPILAHPILYHMSDARLDTLTRKLKAAGLMGIEAVYSTYSHSEEWKMRKLADKYNLCISGGSDFHGSTKPSLEMATGYGKLVIPEEILINLKKRKEMEHNLTRQMDNNKPKIFFTDLDGTLLTKEKKITPATMEALKKWTAAGNKLALSSGRAIDSIKDVKDSLGLDFPGMYLIGYNGGEIYDCEAQKVVSRISLSMEQVAIVARMAKEQGIHCQTYTDTHIISPADNDELHVYQRSIHSPVIISEDIMKPLDREPCKCLAIEIHDKEKLEHFRQSLLPFTEGELSLLYSNDKYLEIFPASSGKETAVVKLCELLDIPIENTIAAGDASNDISMIQAAGVGIAMLNAKEDVKKAADIITAADNNQDGLAAILLSCL